MKKRENHLKYRPASDVADAMDKMANFLLDDASDLSKRKYMQTY